MFIPLWLTFLASGTVMAVFTLMWAIRSRQFDDQDRARYIPLQGLSAAELSAPVPPRRRAGRVGIALIVVSGGLAILATLALILGVI
jgi:cbb3-type cytochrome oxidase maturation protein